VSRRQLRSDIVYKNKAFARGGDGEDPQSLYDKVVKLGGLPKRLDRLIEESKHLQVRILKKKQVENIYIKVRIFLNKNDFLYSMYLMACCSTNFYCTPACWGPLSTMLWFLM
jgi:hypothetical protein